MESNFAEWEITLQRVRDGNFQLAAYAEDDASNVEKTRHERILVVR